MVFVALGVIVLGFIIYFFVSKGDIDEHPDYTGKYTRPKAATNSVQNPR